jgi:hypothetical protein
MAKDHNKYGNLDNENPKVLLVRALDVTTGEEIIMTKKALNEDTQNKYKNLGDVSLSTAIRMLNPDFYPSGYTGYEHYYIDILGFWRQLYNPEYECSYEIEPITRLEYESVQEENKIFYDAPVYTNCTKDSIYYDDIDYYVYTNDSYVLTSVTKTEFNNNKSFYYYVTDMKQ